MCGGWAQKQLVQRWWAEVDGSSDERARFESSSVGLDTCTPSRHPLTGQRWSHYVCLVLATLHSRSAAPVDTQSSRSPLPRVLSPFPCFVIPALCGCAGRRARPCTLRRPCCGASSPCRAQLWCACPDFASCECRLHSQAEEFLGLRASHVPAAFPPRPRWRWHRIGPVTRGLGGRPLLVSPVKFHRRRMKCVVPALEKLVPHLVPGKDGENVTGCTPRVPAREGFPGPATRDFVRFSRPCPCGPLAFFASMPPPSAKLCTPAVAVLPFPCRTPSRNTPACTHPSSPIHPTASLSLSPRCRQPNKQIKFSKIYHMILQ